MKVVAVIPARYGSTRFPGKPLAKIHGKEMVLWVAERTSKAKGLSDVVVATDDERVLGVVKKAGFGAVMTKESHVSGSDRVFEAIEKISLKDDDVVINVQGDEPLVEADWLNQLMKPFEDPQVEMSSLAHEISEEEIKSLNSVKVLVNQKKEAIYFSRFPIPFSRKAASEFVSSQPGAAPSKGWKGLYKHMGFYAYRKEFLAAYCQTAPSFFEHAEALEQLRALDLGAKINIEIISGRSWGVDTPEDLARIEKMLGGTVGGGDWGGAR